ncbi:MAG: spermidine synthase, partial [Pyrinomonadaceae bacterium]
PERHAGLTLLYALTMFVSACLLFWSQPMVAKLLLPSLGGTPAVWNTSLLFFQTLLLAGYAYALYASTRLSLRRQVLVQLALFLVAALALPIGLPASALDYLPRTSNPTPWLLGVLLLTVGLPFFALSTSAPVLQRWFSQTRHREARDPYFLYAASNAGSLVALLGYPLLVEPFFSLRVQTRLWAALYAALALLVALCGLTLWRANKAAGQESQPAGGTDRQIGPLEGESELSETPSAEPEPDTRSRLRWIALAFVPTSLMMGATAYVSTDIASLPLLWVVPLAVYLLTLILAFARRQLISRRVVAQAIPGATLILVLVYLSGATQPALFLVVLHLAFLFVAALGCHQQLAFERPPAKHLAEFYLWMSAGGALGGVFNALVAPAVFDSVIEYPLVILLAALLRPRVEKKEEHKLSRLKIGATEILSAVGDEGTNEHGRGVRWPDFALPLGIGLLAFALSPLVQQLDLPQRERLAVAFGVPLFAAYFLKGRRLRFALAVGAVLLAGALGATWRRTTLHAERNFFGTVRVTGDSYGGGLHWLLNGSTIHGRQFTALDRQCEPLSYYHREGPLGSVFESFQLPPAAPHVAVVGLGAGTTIAYSRPGQNWTLYEINPAVIELARDPRYFTYLSNCANAPFEIVRGDARLRLIDAPPKHFGLIVLDAFSSDAIPVHLMTLEALDLYLTKLAEGGLVVFHISNRSLDLQPVVADLARSRGLQALVFDDTAPDQPGGKEPSQWAVVARRSEDLGALAEDARWRKLESDPNRRVWTDDFSNIVSVLKW